MDRDDRETGRPGARSQIGQNTLLPTDGERLCFDKGEKGFVFQHPEVRKGIYVLEI